MASTNLDDDVEMGEVLMNNINLKTNTEFILLSNVGRREEVEDEEIVLDSGASVHLFIESKVLLDSNSNSFDRMVSNLKHPASLILSRTDAYSESYF